MLKIPALGKHYSQRWAQEDLLEEQREGARANDKKKSILGPLSEIDAKGKWFILPYPTIIIYAVMVGICAGGNFSPKP